MSDFNERLLPSGSGNSGDSRDLRQPPRNNRVAPADLGRQWQSAPAGSRDLENQTPKPAPPEAVWTKKIQFTTEYRIEAKKLLGREPDLDDMVLLATDDGNGIQTQIKFEELDKMSGRLLETVFPIQVKLKKETKIRECAVCMTEAVNTVCLPCKHSIMCEDCIKELRSRGNMRCPYCRARINTYRVGIYDSDFVNFVEEGVNIVSDAASGVAASISEGMYDNIRPLLLCGAIFIAMGLAHLKDKPATDAPYICFVIAFVVAYLPWLVVTIHQFEHEPPVEPLGDGQHETSVEEVEEFVEGRRRCPISAADFNNPCTLIFKLLLVVIALPVAAVIFFLPYFIYYIVIRVVLLRLLPSLFTILLNSLENMVVGLYAGLARVACCGALEEPPPVTLRRQVNESGCSACFSKYIWGPLGECVGSVFAAIGKALHCIVTTIYHIVGKVCGFIYEYILTPLASCIKVSAIGTNDYVLTPAAKGVGKLCCLTYDYVLTPIGMGLTKIAEGLWYCIALLFNTLWHGLVMIATSIWKWIITPIGWAIYYIGVAIYRIGEFLVNAMVALAKGFYNYVLLPLGMAIRACGIFIYQYILTPIAGFIYAVGAMLVNGLVALVTGFYNYVLLNIWKVLVVVCSALGRCVVSVATVIGNILYKVGEIIVNVLTKIAEILATMARALYQWVIKPIGMGTYYVVSLVALGIYKVVEFLILYIIKPIIQAIVLVVTTIAQGIASVVKSLVNNVVVPIAQAIGYVVSAIADVVKQLAIAVSNVISGIVNFISGLVADTQPRGATYDGRRRNSAPPR